MDDVLHRSARIKAIAQRQTAALMAADPAAEDRLVTTVRTDVLHDLQIRADVEGHRFVADEPVPKGGHDAGPAPLRYFLAGVLMCHQVWVVKGAALRDVTLGSLHGEIDAYVSRAPAADGSRPFSRLDYRLDIETEASPATVGEIVADASRNCPAVATVRIGAELRIFVQHNGHRVAIEADGAAHA